MLIQCYLSWLFSQRVQISVILLVKVIAVGFVYVRPLLPTRLSAGHRHGDGGDIALQVGMLRLVALHRRPETENLDCILLVQEGLGSLTVTRESSRSWMRLFNSLMQLTTPTVR
jgi:hypothetical protein